jgi:hypothetical protein
LDRQFLHFEQESFLRVDAGKGAHREAAAQAKALDRANQIRAYAEAALLRAAEMSIEQAEVGKWAA